MRVISFAHVLSLEFSAHLWLERIEGRSMMLVVQGVLSTLEWVCGTLVEQTGAAWWSILIDRDRLKVTSQ